MNKRGQFFLLAAVIISVVVLSLGVTTNKAISNEEPENFYDFGYEVQREVGAVIDYEIYSGFTSGTNLEDFVNLLSDDIGDRNPDSAFFIVYGNESEVSIKGYESKKIKENKSKSEPSSNVCFKGSCKNLFLKDGIIEESTFDLKDVDEFEIEIDGDTFVFPTFKSKQVLFIIKKEVGGEEYVSIK